MLLAWKIYFIIKSVCVFLNKCSSIHVPRYFTKLAGSSLKGLSFIIISEVFIWLFWSKLKKIIDFDSFKDNLLAHNQSTRCFYSKLATDSTVPFLVWKHKLVSSTKSVILKLIKALSKSFIWIKKIMNLV